MKDYKQKLFATHNLFNEADTEDNRIIIRSDIKSIIDNLDAPDSQDLYILGLAYYETSIDIHDIDNSHKYFIESLKENKKYYMARLYSAHCYHDKKEYDSALSEYLKVDCHKLKTEFPIWRFIKLQEQIGHCLHNLGKENEAKKYFQITLDLYRKEPYEDLVDPLEVYECLAETDPICRELKIIENDYYNE